MLEFESSISEDVIAARGYSTTTVKANLERLGFSKTQHNVPALLLPIFGPEGEVRLYQTRPDTPRIRDGKPVKYETPKGSRMTLDVHPFARNKLDDPATPLFITEGIKKGDALVSRGLCAVALIGVWNWRGTNEKSGKTVLAEWEYVALNGRQVYVVFDSDVMLKTAVHAALSRLKSFLEHRGAKVALIYLPSGDSASKQGVDDFLASGHTVDDLLALASPELRSLEGDEDDGAGTDDEKRTQAQLLVELALEHTSELFHAPDEAAYAVVPVAEHYEVFRMRHKGFRSLLYKLFYETYGKPPGTQAVQDALAVLEAKARFDGEECPVHVRIAEREGVIYLDLGDEGWRVVEIDAKGWRIRARSPVMFERPKGLRPLPTPTEGGAISALRRFVNVSVNDWYLLLAFLVACLYPKGPFPLLILIAEQGSGKTTLARIIKLLIDANLAPVRSAPRNERDLMIGATHSWLLVFDNLSAKSRHLNDPQKKSTSASRGGVSTLAGQSLRLMSQNLHSP